MKKNKTWRWLFDFANIRREQPWRCTFCHVIGSHRRGCHYVAEAHHHPAKRARYGVLGLRARTARASAAK